MSSKKHRNGFTLIELLSVVAIVGIVAGISYPVFSRVKHSAKVSKTVSNLHSLHLAAMLYQSDNQGASQGTPEEMGLPNSIGTMYPFPNTQSYSESWYKDMKSPFGEPPKYVNYNTFAIPSQYDGLPITWSQCTTKIGDSCILYWDPFEPGRDETTGWWASTVDYAVKRLHGVTLAGNLVTRQDFGSPLSQAWWAPGKFAIGN